MGNKEIRLKSNSCEPHGYPEMTSPSAKNSQSKIRLDPLENKATILLPNVRVHSRLSNKDLRSNSHVQDFTKEIFHIMRMKPKIGGIQRKKLDPISTIKNEEVLNTTQSDKEGETSSQQQLTISNNEETVAVKTPLMKPQSRKNSQAINVSQSPGNIKQIGVANAVNVNIQVKNIILQKKKEHSNSTYIDIGNSFLNPDTSLQDSKNFSKTLLKLKERSSASQKLLEVDPEENNSPFYTIDNTENMYSVSSFSKSKPLVRPKKKKSNILLGENNVILVKPKLDASDKQMLIENGIDKQKDVFIKILDQDTRQQALEQMFVPKSLGKFSGPAYEQTFNQSTDASPSTFYEGSAKTSSNTLSYQYPRHASTNQRAKKNENHSNSYSYLEQEEKGTYPTKIMMLGKQKNDGDISPQNLIYSGSCSTLLVDGSANESSKFRKPQMKKTASRSNMIKMAREGVSMPSPIRKLSVSSQKQEESDKSIFESSPLFRQLGFGTGEKSLPPIDFSQSVANLHNQSINSHGRTSSIMTTSELTPKMLPSITSTGSIHFFESKNGVKVNPMGQTFMKNAAPSDPAPKTPVPSKPPLSKQSMKKLNYIGEKLKSPSPDNEARFQYQKETVKQEAPLEKKEVVPKTKDKNDIAYLLKEKYKKFKVEKRDGESNLEYNYINEMNGGGGDHSEALKILFENKKVMKSLAERKRLWVGENGRFKDKDLSDWFDTYDRTQVVKQLKKKIKTHN